MSSSILHALGGLGLFLLGMKIMTDGLKAVAEDRLHRWLARVTHTPLSGAATGALTTAVIQSSTATTVATATMEATVTVATSTGAATSAAS